MSENFGIVRASIIPPWWTPLVDGLRRPLPLVIIASLAGACWLPLGMSGEPTGYPVLAGFFALGLVGWSGCLSVGSWLSQGSVNWVLTDRQVLSTRRGLFWGRKDYLDLHRIQDVQVDSPFPYSLLNYGYVRIFSTDKTDRDMLIGPVHDPSHKAEQLLRDVTSRQKETGVVEAQLLMS
jgi:hypothetical protein